MPLMVNFDYRYDYPKDFKDTSYHQKKIVKFSLPHDMISYVRNKDTISTVFGDSTSSPTVTNQVTLQFIFDSTKEVLRDLFIKYRYFHDINSGANSGYYQDYTFFTFFNTLELRASGDSIFIANDPGAPFKNNLHSTYYFSALHYPPSANTFSSEYQTADSVIEDIASFKCDLAFIFSQTSDVAGDSHSALVSKFIITSSLPDHSFLLPLDRTLAANEHL
jgi:hypothetical protein